MSEGMLKIADRLDQVALLFPEKDGGRYARSLKADAEKIRLDVTIGGHDYAMERDMSRI